VLFVGSKTEIILHVLKNTHIVVAEIYKMTLGLHFYLHSIYRMWVSQGLNHHQECANYDMFLASPVICICPCRWSPAL